MKPTQTQPETPSPLREKASLLLSFLIPFVILGTMFALHGVYPFGDRHLLYSDYYHQYFPFLSDFWHKLREGGSMLWSWTAGTGHDYVALIAYYLASPLNLLTLLFPHAWLREVLAVILLIKIGLAGLFCALYLRYTHKRRDLAQPFFAMFYALCAFALGYSWNIMWFDTFALLSLVVLGVQAMVREGKCRLYTVSLALAVIINYHIGIIVCLFVAAMFFVYCAVHKIGWRSLLAKLRLILLCSAIGLGMTALLTVPAFSALQNAYGGAIRFPATLELYTGFADMLGNLIAFTPATVREGLLPNLYCGMISVLLLAVFVRSPKVSKQEKAGYMGLVIFLIVSCNINILSFVWHGLRFPTMLPYRFSFLISFALVIMAYRVYLLRENLTRRDLPAPCFAAAFFLLMAIIGPQEWKYIIGSMALCAAYLVLFAVYVRVERIARPKHHRTVRRIACQAMALVMIAELAGTAYIATKSIVLEGRFTYPDRYDQVQQLLGKREPGNPSFYRTEFTNRHSLNVPSLYGFDGVSFFSSTANVNVTRFMMGMGVAGGEAFNRYCYGETSPLANAFLSVRYLISRSQDSADGGAYWDQIAEVPGAKLLENNRYLPLGFMVNAEVAGYSADQNNAFEGQNDSFRRATGLDGDLFTIFQEHSTAHHNYAVSMEVPGEYAYSLIDGSFGGILQWNYEAPKDGPLYAYVKLDNRVDEISVTANGQALRDIYVRLPGIVCIGNFAKGDLISVFYGNSADEGGVRICAAYLDDDLFEQGYAILAGEPLHLTQFSETEVTGTVTALRDGLLYTSIPYDKGWRAYVDGEESGIVPVGGAMAALWIEKGTHSVEFRYHNNAVTAGAAISLISMAAFAALILLDLRRKRNKVKAV